MSAAEAARIAGKLRGDWTRYRWMMDSGHVRHALRSHGSRAAEAAKKPPQRPLKKSDVARLGSAMRPATLVTAFPPGRRRAGSLRFTGRDGRSRYGVVWEIRSARRELALKTMWKHG